MSNKYKKINIENGTYYFFNDMINTENINLNKVNKDKKSYKRIFYLLYRIRDNQRPT